MLQDAKALVRAFHAELDSACSSGLTAVLAKYSAPDLLWRGMHPFYEQTGPQAVAEVFWQPLRSAMGPMQRRPDIFIAGANEIDGERSIWVASMGHLVGRFSAPWLGIRPSNRMTFLRYAEFCKVENGQITEMTLHCDILHIMAQSGLFPVPFQTGANIIAPGPRTHDGLLYAPQDPCEGVTTLALINKMATAITDHRKYLSHHDELEMTWADDMIWNGPTGIGATYTIDRYIDQHSGPFRRHLKGRKFNGHLARIGEGNYGGFFGWPNLTLQNAGGYLGMPAAPPADMRVIDMYRREGDRLAENWVFIDLLHWFAQQGLDILARNSEGAYD